MPIHLQITEMMIRDIAAGRLVDGQKLPPERQMAQAHDTTVRTLRKALAELEAQGLLDRRQGSGTTSGRANRRGRSIRCSGWNMRRAGRAAARGCCRSDRIPGCRPARLWQRRSRHPVPAPAVPGRHPIAVEEIWLDGGAGAIPRDGPGFAVPDL
ncbi:winged helix-turn-helix domain-containing protein [Paracoccus marcusii]|uniref:winged helix-turn-helix domain-containing protein n=1 Tax=Paracoccus marcusii TaxID=59779 RepID=UPI002ED21EB4|nr:winged helix-turn-helix domain-containing protein [Paracoccus marcusii]